MYAIQEVSQYREFTKPAALHKAVNTLRGIVAGITTDAKVAPDEMTELVHWCEIHSELRDFHPFSELLPVIETACADDILTDDESKDILWLCSNFVDNNSYYNEITSSIQFLSGMIHGMLADGTLADAEIIALQAWVDANKFMTGTYPFDEICSLLNIVMADKQITTEEREKLLAFFGNLIEFKDSYNLVESDFKTLQEKYSVGGICAICPKIDFEGKTFCITGESYRGSRTQLARTVERLGGIIRSCVSVRTDYLVVGNAGNPCWAYACYGRKIEDAVKLRKDGATVTIVNETDFWDAVEDADAGISAE